MSSGERIPLSAVELVPEYTQSDTGTAIVWVPDAIDLKLLRQGGDEAPEEERHSDTCLEHVFLLLDQLETGESGSVLWGTSGMDVAFDGDQVALAHKGTRLVGSAAAAGRMVEQLVRETFAELRRQGVDTGQVARELQRGRFASRPLDPVAVHDRLTD